ncbi:hypothetical protein J2W27_000035 [Variovorax boronicumulans]|uniref:hypothetical protein n=1 Tax=Variovorax boronicumulans TaxID=436515 RepID=UPI00277D51E0|nr:hypothetical protein [Variovorax boronicumulans]MDP9907942.1 hypothetical protein [Variovorax boronicumulans]
MPEWFFSLLLSYPGAFNAVGRALFSLAGLLAVLGLRLDRIGGKVERMSARVGIVPPDFLAVLPWWLRMVVPETVSGWVLLAGLALMGIWLAHIGKWAKKLQT